jgi:hypothetical protein
MSSRPAAVAGIAAHIAAGIAAHIAAGIAAHIACIAAHVVSIAAHIAGIAAHVACIAAHIAAGIAAHIACIAADVASIAAHPAAGIAAHIACIVAHVRGTLDRSIGRRRLLLAHRARHLMIQAVRRRHAAFRTDGATHRFKIITARRSRTFFRTRSWAECRTSWRDAAGVPRRTHRRVGPVDLGRTVVPAPDRRPGFSRLANAVVE